MPIETLKKSHLKRNIIIVVIVVALITTLILNFTRAKYRNTQSIPLINGTITFNNADLNVIAMYQQDDTGEYVSIDKVPNGGTKLNQEKSYCEVNGEKDDTISMNYENGKVYIGVVSKGTKCYLYFDDGGIRVLATINGDAADTFPQKSSNYTIDSIVCNNDATAKFNYEDWIIEIDGIDGTACTVNFVENTNQSFADYLISKTCSSTPTTNEEAKDCLVNENGYRYEGTIPNNYVQFNGELWRVIGVFSVTTAAGTSQNLVKIIRNEVLDSLAIHESRINTWSSTRLPTILNNGYLNKTDTTCNFYLSNTKTCYFGKTGIKSTSRNMIESVIWNVGGARSASATASSFYSSERGQSVYSGSTTWTGKIGLIYPSDYGYAVLASSCPRTTRLDNYNNEACAGANWLKSSYSLWTMTQDSSSYYSIYYINGLGNIYSWSPSFTENIKPVLYLKANVSLLGGNGTIDEPFALSLAN